MRRRITVLVLVLGFLLTAGLAVIATIRAREAAGRMQCQNNLKQIALAVHNHAGTFDSLFPTATIPVEGLSPEKRLSWLVSIMPYMDQIGLGIDRTKAWDAEKNLEPTFNSRDIEHRTEVVRPVGEYILFCCPAHSATAEPGSPGLTHYVSIAGLGSDAASRSAGYPGIGFFGHDRRTRLEDVKDGAATTIMVIETTWKNGPWTAGGYPTDRGLDPGAGPYLGTRGQFGSNHIRGDLFAASPPCMTNAAFVDGSVRSPTSAIKPEVFEALATIAGGEDVSEAVDW
jgi:hypothetical protein